MVTTKSKPSRFIPTFRHFFSFLSIKMLPHGTNFLHHHHTIIISIVITTSAAAFSQAQHHYYLSSISHWVRTFEQHFRKHCGWSTHSSEDEFMELRGTWGALD
jgi:hypothetical protein